MRTGVAYVNQRRGEGEHADVAPGRPLTAAYNQRETYRSQDTVRWRTMNYTEIRKLSLKVFIGFLVLTALIAIISVLSGEFGELQVKILATTFTISAASICSMSCAAFIEKRKLIGLGLSGILLSVAAAVLVIAGIWPEIDSEEYWKTAITLIVLAIAFAHVFLLVLPELDHAQKWVQAVSSCSIGVLAIQIIVAVWGEINNEDYYRLLAVVAILVGLETLVVPILMKLRKGSSGIRRALMLEHIEGEMYRDSAGKVYNVKEMNTEENAPADADKRRG